MRREVKRLLSCETAFPLDVVHPATAAFSLSTVHPTFDDVEL
jgi:hypothetical protein